MDLFSFSGTPQNDIFSPYLTGLLYNTFLQTRSKAYVMLLLTYNIKAEIQWRSVANTNWHSSKNSLIKVKWNQKCWASSGSDLYIQPGVRARSDSGGKNKKGKVTWGHPFTCSASRVRQIRNNLWNTCRFTFENY